MRMRSPNYIILPMQLIGYHKQIATQEHFEDSLLTRAALTLISALVFLATGKIWQVYFCLLAARD